MVALANQRLSKRLYLFAILDADHGGDHEATKNKKLLQAKSRHDLPHSETTLAEYFQSAGYRTAMIGKWHLGDADHYPETQGFDINIGGTLWGAPQTFWWPYRGTGRFGSEFRYVPGLEFGSPGEYLTDRLTDEALNFIDRSTETKPEEDSSEKSETDTRQPFFLYLSHYAPHTPIEAKPEDVEYFESKRRPEMNHQNAVYAGMMKSLDESVGRVLAKLKQRGLDDDTIVIFMSDNGGFIGIDRRSGQTIPVTDNTPLRSGKASCYEGGVRVPMIVRWPEVTTKGSVCQEPVVVMDLLPTLLQATGIARSSVADAKDNVVLDGESLVPLLKDPSAKLNREALYFHYPHYYSSTTPVSAIRARDWKLLQYYEDSRVELFHLAEDLGETTNLAKRFPERAKLLTAQLDRWREEVNAQEPTINPNFLP